MPAANFGAARKAWETIKAGSWRGGYANVRGAFRTAGVSRADRYMTSMATRAVAGAIPGAIIGGAWGAASDREGIVTGALKGATVGALLRTGYSYGRGTEVFGRRVGGAPGSTYRALTKLTQARNWRDNLKLARDFVNKRRGLAWTAGGLAAFQGMRGLFSPNDNPLGGAAGGAMAGAMQGTMLYGGYRAMQKVIRR